jgi:hypothetical protein
MMQLNKKQIINDLEKLVDKYGENGSFNTYIIISNAFKLIKEQAEEIERLNKALTELINQYENDEIQFYNAMTIIRSDTVDKILKQAKEYIYHLSDGTDTWGAVDIEDLERIADEIKENTK